jgi:hypothetical protein
MLETLLLYCYGLWLSVSWKQNDEWFPEQAVKLLGLLLTWSTGQRLADRIGLA